MLHRSGIIRFCAALSIFTARAALAQTTTDAPTGNPVAIVNLATEAGTGLVHGQWRFRDAQIVEVDHRDPGPDLRASGAPNRTHDLLPHAGVAGFDDSAWEPIAPSSLDTRRSHGRLSFSWYRIRVTVPEQIGDLDPTGMTVVFEIVVDDYAEVWVNGQLPLVLGQAGGQLVRGFNAPNRVVLTRSAKPGQQFQLAILGINGPISNPPVNFIWVRSATLDFYRPAQASVGQDAGGEIVRLDPAINSIIGPQGRLEKLAGGFQFLEGPIWIPAGDYLLFSDPNANVIYRWTEDGQVSVYRTKSGYAGVNVGEYHQPGSNGLTLDGQGRLTINEHGNRRVTRLERTGALTVVADRFEGKRLNSPNDLVYKSDGALYFTDPPFGLPHVFADSARELPFSGVYRVKDGNIQLLVRDLAGPNGIAFSPDEKYLYVDNWDPARKVIMRYAVQPDGSVADGRVFFDATAVSGDDAWDGLKVDQQGNLYAAGPGGIYILSSDGRHLGTIRTPEHAANFAWGDPDAQTLYITASTGLYRIRLNIPGIRPGPTTQLLSTMP